MSPRPAVYRRAAQPGMGHVMVRVAPHRFINVLAAAEYGLPYDAEAVGAFIIREREAKT